MAISGSLVGFAISIGIFAILAIGMNIKFGYTGLLEIGHVAFFMIGAYLTVLLVLPPPSQNPGTTYLFGLGLPWFLAVPIACIVVGFIGAIVSLPTIRLREDYLAITLLGVSYLVLQMFRNEGWLANGPRSLTGFDLPLVGQFPLLGSELEPLSFAGAEIPAGDALVFGIVVGIFWLTGTALMAAIEGIDEVDGPRDLLAHGLLALTTFGVGYGAARLAARNPDERLRYAVGAGALVGGVAALAAFVGVPAGLGDLLVLGFLGAFSLFTWVVGLLYLSNRYEAAGAREYLVALGITLGFFVALAPVVSLSGSAETEVIGSLLTLVLLAVYIYGLVRIGRSWEEYDLDVGILGALGLAAVWLFALRYFVVSVVDSTVPILDTVQNLVWLVKFDANLGLVFDYNRFLLLLVVGVLAGVYYASELAVKSPFGRVLKAIREDEDVATALGKNTFVYKVQGMALGSAIAGLAGALTAIQFQALNWTIFRIQVTFFVLLMVIIGGTANNKGAILGSIIFWSFRRGTADLADYFPDAVGSSVLALRLVIIGLLLIVILYYRPEGLWGEDRETMNVDTTRSVAADGGTEVSD